MGTKKLKKKYGHSKNNIKFMRQKEKRNKLS